MSDDEGIFADITGAAAARRVRQPGRCENCGTERGSMVHDTEDGWTLCRSCMNDPDVLAEHADG